MTHSSFGWSTAAGAISSLVLAQFLIMSFNKSESLKADALAEKDYVEEEGRYSFGWSWRFMSREKRQIIPIIVAMGTFISNWVLWGREYFVQTPTSP